MSRFLSGPGRSSDPSSSRRSSLFESASARETSLCRQIQALTEERLIRIDSLAAEATLDAEGILVQDRLSVDAALASYRTGSVPFVTVLEALGTYFSDRRAAVVAPREPDPGGGRPLRVLPRPQRSGAHGLDDGRGRRIGQPEDVGTEMKKNRFLAIVLTVSALRRRRRIRPGLVRMPEERRTHGCRQAVPLPDAPRHRQGRPGRLPDLRHEARPDRGRGPQAPVADEAAGNARSSFTGLR